MRQILATFFLLLALAPAGAAGIAIPEPDARVVVAGGAPGADGRYLAGLAIGVAAGWHTYWKTPGDAGIPPVIDLAESDNLGAVRIDFPVPERYFDGFGTSFVYAADVMLPLHVAPADPARPVHLRGRVSYGLCQDVCVPAEVEVDAVLAPDAPADAAARAAIDAALARVPQPLDDGGHLLRLDKVAIDAARGAGTVTVSVEPGADVVDVFASGPGDWYVGPPDAGEAAGRRTYSIPIEGAPRGGLQPDTRLMLTVVGRARSVDMPLRLD